MTIHNAAMLKEGLAAALRRSRGMRVLLSPAMTTAAQRVALQPLFGAKA